MSPDDTIHGANDERPEELGQPIAELERLEHEPTRGFLASLRRRLGRRTLSNQFLVVSWYLPALVFVEFLKLTFDLLLPPKEGEGDGK
jgi:hypothetical protein